METKLINKTIRIDSNEYEKLDAIAKESGRTAPSVIRLLIKNYLLEEEGNETK